MKKLRRFGTAVFAVAIAVGMCACNKDNEKIEKLKEQIEELEEELDDMTSEPVQPVIKKPEPKVFEMTSQKEKEKPGAVAIQVKKPKIEHGDPEFDKKYAELMKKKGSADFENLKFDFVTYFGGVANAAGLSEKQLKLYNELASDFGLEVESSADIIDKNETGGDAEKSKKFKEEYEKLAKYLRANQHPERQFSKPAQILEACDKQLNMIREFMDNWETFPKTEKEQKMYDDVLKKYKVIQRNRDLYSM